MTHEEEFTVSHFYDYSEQVLQGSKMKNIYFENKQVLHTVKLRHL